MKDIKIVIGSNFGDEGKGMMTDFFSQKSNSIVVCSNGGAQRQCFRGILFLCLRSFFHRF